jgi:hypothetical protein
LLLKVLVEFELAYSSAEAKARGVGGTGRSAIATVVADGQSLESSVKVDLTSLPAILSMILRGQFTAPVTAEKDLLANTASICHICAILEEAGVKQKTSRLVLLIKFSLQYVRA